MNQWRAESLQDSKAATDALLKGFSAQAPSFEEQQCEIQRQYTAKPVNCPMGNDDIAGGKLQAYVQEFKDVWTAFKTELKGDTCCMGINHQFAIYSTIRELQPLVIIESGAAAGRGTWLLRHTAGPTVPIFSIDPGDPVAMYGPIKGWKDPNPQTTYFNAQNFQDLSMIRWDVYIPDPAIRARTLIILDDHQSSIVRLKMLRNWGFRHVFYEDNYPFGVATSADAYTCPKLGASMPRPFQKPLFGDAYSPNTVCAAVPPGWNFVLEKDRFGNKCSFLTLPQHSENVKWFQDHIASYFEFPAIFSKCSGLSRLPILGSDPATLALFGFPKVEEELWAYGHLFPALIDLKPLGKDAKPTLVAGQMQMVSEEAQGTQAALANIASQLKDITEGKWFG